MKRIDTLTLASRAFRIAAIALVAGLAVPVAVAQDAEEAKQAEAANQTVKKIGLGDPAPELKVGKWVKGSPVASFEKGKVYVVEFWATWCGPCKATIPHITDLAKKYKGKATFAGISVFERGENYFSKVESFVEKMGDKMDYNVAADTAQADKGHMAQAWMEAADQDGIPTTFIINGEGKIAWIGYPTEMDGPLEEIVAGKWDIAKAQEAAKVVAAKREVQMKFQEVMQTEGEAFIRAMQGEDHVKAAAEIDALAAKHPEIKDMLNRVKFQALIRGDEKAAYALAKTMASGNGKEDPQLLNELAWTILDTKELKTPDYDVALSIAKQAADVTKHADAMILDTYSLALFKKGDVAKAIEVQTKAVEMAKKMSGAPEETVTEMTDRLEEYKKAMK